MTNGETKVLKAIKSADYGEGNTLVDHVFEDLAGDYRVPQIKGFLGSLAKKGLITITGMEHGSTIHNF